MKWRIFVSRGRIYNEPSAFRRLHPRPLTHAAPTARSTAILCPSLFHSRVPSYVQTSVVIQFVTQTEVLITSFRLIWTFRSEWKKISGPCVRDTIAAPYRFLSLPALWPVPCNFFFLPLSIIEFTDFNEPPLILLHVAVIFLVRGVPGCLVPNNLPFLPCNLVKFKFFAAHVQR